MSNRRYQLSRLLSEIATPDILHPFGTACRSAGSILRDRIMKDSKVVTPEFT